MSISSSSAPTAMRRFGLNTLITLGYGFGALVPIAVALAAGSKIDFGNFGTLNVWSSLWWLMPLSSIIVGTLLLDRLYVNWCYYEEGKTARERLERL